jgi:hypothetical protein
MGEYSPALNVRFGLEAAVPLQVSYFAAWRSAHGQKRTDALQKETRRSGFLMMV